MFCANLGAVLSIGGGEFDYWVSTLLSSSAAKALPSGSGIAIDSVGNSITAGSDGSASVRTGVYITKLSPAGVKVWQAKIASTSSNLQSYAYPSPVAVDSADNVITCIADAVNGTYYVFKHDSAGALVWQRRIPAVSVGGVYDSSGLVIDPSDNIWVHCYSNSVSTLFRISSAGTVTQQVGFGSLLQIHTLAAFGSNFILAGNGTVHPLLLAVTPTGVAVWGQTFSAGVIGKIYGVAVDASSNVYAVGQTAGASPAVWKYNSLGVLQWKKLVTTPATAQFNACAVDASGNLYVVGTVGGSQYYGIAMCIDSSGAIVWQTKVHGVTYGAATEVGLRSVDSRTGGKLSIGGFTNISLSSDTEQAIVLRIPTAAATVGTYGALIFETSAFVISNITATATAVSQAVTNPTNTLTTTALVGSTTTAVPFTARIASYPYKLTKLVGNAGSVEITLQVTGVVADTLGNVYSIAIPMGASNTCVYIAKTSASGQLVWQRRYLTGYAVGGPNILINPAQDTLYVILNASPPTVITYSTDGVLGLQRRLTNQTSAASLASNGPIGTIDPDGNVYVVASSGANAEVIVSKLSPSLALVYSKKVAGVSTYSAGDLPTITVDQSGDFYFSARDIGLNVGFIAKISTSGTVVAWQRYVKDATSSFPVMDMKVSASGYLYTLAYDANNQDRITIGKYSAATGALQWQKRISGLATVTGEFALTLDSNDNCYAVTTVLTVSSIYYALLVKLDSSGNQVWQRKLTGGAPLFSANNICMSGDNTIIVGGQFISPPGNGQNSSGGYWTLNADGTVLGTWGVTYAGTGTDTGFPYATNAATIAANTPIATVPAAAAISTYAYAATTPTNTSTTTTGNLSQLAEIS